MRRALPLTALLVALLPVGSANAVCDLGVQYQGRQYTSAGALAVGGAATGAPLSGAVVPPCNDVIIIRADPAGNAVTTPPDGEATPVAARAIKEVSVELAIAARVGARWQILVARRPGGEPRCLLATPRRVLACLLRLSRFRLEIDRPDARPGEIIRIRVQAAKGAEGVSGISSTLLERRDGSWRPIFDLIHPLPGGDTLGRPARPSSPPHDPRRAYRSIGIRTGFWLDTLVPDVPPGRYRILREVVDTAPGGPATIRLVADLRVLGP